MLFGVVVQRLAASVDILYYYIPMDYDTMTHVLIRSLTIFVLKLIINCILSLHVWITLLYDHSSEYFIAVQYTYVIFLGLVTVLLVFSIIIIYLSNLSSLYDKILSMISFILNVLDIFI